MSSFVERLILAQQSVGTVKRDQTNPRFGSKYASLDAIIEAVRPALAAQGLLLTQHVEDGHVSTRISGSQAGEQLYSSVPVCAPLDDPQRFGAALTYARRYGIATLLALATDDDQDGNDAQPVRTTDPVAVQTPPRAAPQAAENARQAAASTGVPLAVERLGAVEIHFGKNKGTSLGMLTENQLRWYATEWEPRFNDRTGRLDDQDERLKLAAKQLYVGLKNPAALLDPAAASAIIPGGYIPADTAPAVIADESDGIPF